ncbi:LysM peptidoglycan-binding domain-containing protein [Vibrio mexicanus]|uniref:LysM peptidoglycan-binding domain-containing protein n=1 Tax=Vibrio mexicanus TaxID=1004326 RepID=UPI00063C97CA|nr:LysM peptidoglycan-binding domain-containing protein [Vibrio mexicanus]
MRRLIRCVLLGLTSLPLAFSANVLSDSNLPVVLKSDAPQTYTVVKGDTLWDISALYLDSPWLWPKLWQINPEINNPHLIYPGDKITLVWKNGQPTLSLKTMVKLSPKVRVRDKKAISAVEESLVLPYLKSDRLVDEQTLTQSAVVLGASSGTQYLNLEDTFYISGEHSARDWGIYRQVKRYQRGEHIAVSLKRVATATLQSGYPEKQQNHQEYTALVVTEQNSEIMANDLALPDDGRDGHSFDLTFYPQPSPADSFAQILGSLSGSQYVAQNQLVVIDRGLSDDLRQGSMFSLFEQGATAQSHFAKVPSSRNGEITLPDTHVGDLMVVKPYDHFSLALVTDSRAPIGQQTKAFSPLSESNESVIEPLE